MTIFAHMYFASRLPCQWKYDDFKKYYTSEDVAECWLGTLNGVLTYKGAGPEHLEAASKLIALANKKPGVTKKPIASSAQNLV
ncbi:hypothetical protein BGX34_003584 [Mortierella sp. NVP85]|nr:hypothetical protein BGX34_003584 [Mortierella sp. NVP85]